jgi:WD40 repeat protein
MRLSPDAQALIVETIDDKRFYLVDAATGERRGAPIELGERSDQFYDWTFNSKRLIATAPGKTIVIRDVGTGTVVHSFQVDRDSACVTAFSPDGQWFAHSDPTATIRIVNSETGEELRTLQGLAGKVLNVAISPGGSRTFLPNGMMSWLPGLLRVSCLRSRHLLPAEHWSSSFPAPNQSGVGSGPDRSGSVPAAGGG